MTDRPIPDDLMEKLTQSLRTARKARPVTAHHEFAPKTPGGRWCCICDRKDTDPAHYPPAGKDQT